MLKISEFMRDFYFKLNDVVPEDLKRELAKHERVVKHALYMVVSGKELFYFEDAAKFQEKFHVKMDQMAGDYQTWKRAGCKAYAKPKQYVSGRIAGASKKAFDMVLNTYILRLREMGGVRPLEIPQREEILVLEESGEEPLSAA
jgi:hypothetical protein